MRFRGTKVEIISFSKISTSYAEARQSRKAMQADDGEEASSPSSPTSSSGSQSCLACAGLIPRDWLRRLQHCQSGWPATEGAASTWGKTKWGCSQVVSRQMLFVGMISKSAHRVKCALVFGFWFVMPPQLATQSASASTYRSQIYWRYVVRIKSGCNSNWFDGQIAVLAAKIGEEIFESGNKTCTFQLHFL